MLLNKQDVDNNGQIRQSFEVTVKIVPRIRLSAIIFHNPTLPSYLILKTLEVVFYYFLFYLASSIIITLRKGKTRSAHKLLCILWFYQRVWLWQNFAEKKYTRCFILWRFDLKAQKLEKHPLEMGDFDGGESKIQVHGLWLLWGILPVFVSCHIFAHNLN